MVFTLFPDQQIRYKISMLENVQSGRGALCFFDSSVSKNEKNLAETSALIKQAMVEAAGGTPSEPFEPAWAPAMLSEMVEKSEERR